MKDNPVFLLSFLFIVTVDTACQEDFFYPFSWRFVIVVILLSVTDKPMFLLLWIKRWTKMSSIQNIYVILSSGDCDHHLC